MIDREKAIKGLECCLANGHNNCPYKSTDEGIDKVTSCTTYLMKDALAMLKEQEPVEPIRMHHTADKYGDHYKCKICGSDLYFEQCFCECCGRETKWDEWKEDC